MTPQWVRDRIASATKVPQDHLEPTKLTRYDNGEFFHKHTDASFLNEKMFAFAAKLADVDEEGADGVGHGQKEEAGDADQGPNAVRVF